MNDVAPTLDRELVVARAASLFEGERDAVADAANLCALLYGALPDCNWVGFYFVRGNELVLGPFMGKPASARIARGSGVCGTAWLRAETIVVPDVALFPGHIACDAASNAEIVVPLVAPDGTVFGVLDLDSPKHDRFDTADREMFEELARRYVAATDRP